MAFAVQYVRGASIRPGNCHYPAPPACAIVGLPRRGRIGARPSLLPHAAAPEVDVAFSVSVMCGNACGNDTAGDGAAAESRRLLARVQAA